MLTSLIKRVTLCRDARSERPSPSKGTLSRSFYNGRSDRASLQRAIRLALTGTDVPTTGYTSRFNGDGASLQRATRLALTGTDALRLDTPERPYNRYTSRRVRCIKARRRPVGTLGLSVRPRQRGHCQDRSTTDALRLNTSVRPYNGLLVTSIDSKTIH